ncbi:MAG TPA: 4'-phosphopantetheinyl transferase superfamily protein [Xanthomonadales bacterium]|nr:4'-phosphopantetheinyl transferase superfamily protein [Xanthomonadales bacterium]
MSDPGWRPVPTPHPADSFGAGTVDVWRVSAPRGAPAVRALVARYAGAHPESLRVVAGAHGKPMLEAAPLRFNLSHSGGTTLLAFALDVEVGIDVEHDRIVRRRDALLRRCFTPAEQARIAGAADPDAALLAAWTAKEAVVKAIGRGLAYGLAKVQLDLSGPAPALAALAGDAGPAMRWRLRSLPAVPGAALALAHGAAPLALRCFAV